MHKKLDTNIKGQIRKAFQGVSYKGPLIICLQLCRLDTQQTDKMHILHVGFQIKVHSVYHENQQGPSALG